MKEKVKRILDLVRAGKLTLEDAAPLLAALNTKLALQGSDRELIDSLLGREDVDTAQVAEHLLLLRGVKDTPPAPPQPPRAPSWGGWSQNFDDRLGDLDERIRAKVSRAEAQAERANARAARRGRGIEGMIENITDTVERAVETAMEGVDRSMTGTSYSYEKRPNSANRILKLEVESSSGDEYNANIPVSLAGHLEKLIPPHGIRALESAGFSLETLQLLIEADPPSGELISAEDSSGNEVRISIK